MNRLTTHGVVMTTLMVLATLGVMSVLGGSSPSTVSAHPARPTPTPPIVPTTTTGASWTLIDNHQNTCYFFPQASSDTNYYAIWIQGTWSHAITAGISRLPKGATWYTFSSPIPPGSSNGVGSLADVAVQLPSSTPVGTYTASLWATDGTFTEAVPVTLTVQGNCGGY